MSIKKIILLISPVLLLLSCNKNKNHDYNLYTITIENDDYIFKGEKKYQANKQVELQIIPKNKAFLLPNEEDIIPYGASNISYNKETGILNFIINNDIKLDVKSNCIYGREVKMNEAANWFNAHNKEDETFTWTKKTYEWDLPNVKFPDTNITNFIMDLFENETLDVHTNKGESEILNTTGEQHNHYEVGILGRSNNRWYISNDRLTFGGNILPKKHIAASGGYFIFYSVDENSILDHMDVYFDNYLSFMEEFIFHSPLNGEIHWNSDVLEVK